MANHTYPRGKAPAKGTKIVVGGDTHRSGLSKAPKPKGNATGK